MKVFFRQPLANENMDDALELMRHPLLPVSTFSDSGARTCLADHGQLACRRTC